MSKQTEFYVVKVVEDDYGTGLLMPDGLFEKFGWKADNHLAFMIDDDGDVRIKKIDYNETNTSGEGNE